jgi:D-alanine-D-alanine ligase
MSRVADPKTFGRVAVLMGGWSTEREVSLWSGKNILEALLRKNVDASGVDVKDPEVLLGLRPTRFDRAFNILHGTGGEDGTAQAVLDLVGVPYAGSGVLASALAMDKLRSKRIWKAEGLPTPEYAVLADVGEAKAAAGRFGYPFVIKPSAEGSSVGVTIVKSAEQIEKAFTDARGNGRAVMAEKFVKGAELTVSMLADEALPSIRIVPAGEFYDYHAKYIAEDTKYECPSGVSVALEQQLADLSVRAFDLLGCRGWGRVDFLLDAAQQPWLIEVNTLPGMTSHSLVPMSAKAAGMSYEQLCVYLLSQAALDSPHA